MHHVSYDNAQGDTVRIHCRDSAHNREVTDRLRQIGVTKTYLTFCTQAYADWRAEVRESVRRSTPSYR